MSTLSKKIKIPFRILLYIVVFLELLIFTSTKISAQVLINEVSPSSDPEWIELFKTSEGTISLEGCKLYLDDNHDIQTIEFSSSDQFEQSETFKVISKGSYNWSSNWLNNNGDQITLECSFQTDTIAFGDQSGATVAVPESGKTFGRSPDGNGSIVLLENSSQGSNNSGELPLPTPKPTSTPKSTDAPKPTSTPKPTPIPTKAPTPKPTVKQSSLSVLGTEDTRNEDNFDAESDINDTTTNEESENSNGDKKEEKEEEKKDKNKSPYSLPLIIIGIGTLLLGASVAPIIKKKLAKRMLDKKEIEKI